MWHDFVGPVVQLAGDATVGSGVLLESRPRKDRQGWVTHLLTSWHVVRDIYGSTDRVSTPVPVRMYERDGTYRDESARMVAYDVPLDLALLEMDLDEQVPHGARLASRATLERVSVFDPIYAVGCPLGNDPIPTQGEIAATHHLVDDQVYWMVSAQTYIGNSGGGIFDARTHELIGIFSKIYTHGASRTTIVPHMGLATPLPVVYAWLERAGCVALVESAHAGELQTAAAQR
jgi:S1-C subfamily serine protease